MSGPEPDTVPPLVGRDTELRLLAQWQEEAVRGSGRFVLVSAEAGGGKTGLITGFLNGLSAGTAVGVGAAVDLGHDVTALLPVHLALTELRASSPVDDDRQPAMEADLDHDRSMLSLCESLAECPPGSVLVIEDLHWADSATLGFLRMIAGRLRTLSLLVVASFRSDVARGHQLRATVSELSRMDRVTRLAVEPLGRAEIAELYIRAHGEPADQLTLDQLAERTGGNPFHLTEALAAGPDGQGLSLPLEDWVIHRLEQLPDSVTDLVRAAAVAGPVSIDDLAHIGSVPSDRFADALRATTEANVLVVEDDQVRFRHALLAEAAQRMVLSFEAKAIHQQLAERLDGEATTMDELARLARHWHLAGAPERALLAASAAAGKAVDRQFLGVAFVQLSLLLELWDEVDGAQDLVARSRTQVLLETAETAGELGRADEAVRLARRAFTAVADDPDARADAAWRYGYILYGARQLDEAHRLLQSECGRIIDHGPTPDRAALLVASIGMAMSIGDYAAGVDVDPRVVAMTDAVDDDRLRGRLASFRGGCLAATGRLAEGLRLLEAAAEILTEAGDHAFAANAHLNRVTAGFGVDHLDDLLRRTEIGLTASSAIPASRQMALAGSRAELLQYRGRSAEAWTVFDAGSARLVWRTAAERSLALGTLALDAGDQETAKKMADSPDLGAASLNPPMALRAAILQCRVMATFDPDGAGRELMDRFARSSPTSRALHGAVALTYAWEWVSDDSSWRGDLIDTTARVLARREAVQPHSPVGAWMALLAAHGSDRDPAAWDQAVTVCAEAAMMQDRCRSLLGAAFAHLSRGDRAAAGDRLDQAEQLAIEIENQALAEVTRDLRQRARLGAMTAADDLLGLTVREHEVLILLGDGLTNAEIAERLFISAKTASVHVTNLVRKLGLENRRQAGRLARDLGITPG